MRMTSQAAAALQAQLLQAQLLMPARLPLPIPAPRLTFGAAATARLASWAPDQGAVA